MENKQVIQDLLGKIQVRVNGNSLNAGRMHYIDEENAHHYSQFDTSIIQDIEKLKLLITNNMKSESI